MCTLENIINQKPSSFNLNTESEAYRVLCGFEGFPPNSDALLLPKSPWSNENGHIVERTLTLKIQTTDAALKGGLFGANGLWVS